MACAGPDGKRPSSRSVNMPRVLLTRPRMRSSVGDELHRILHTAGMEIEELPMIQFEWPVDVRELDLALGRAARGAFETVLLTSPTAVNFFEERTRELGIFEALRHAARF